jgi:hypothetical protein
VGGDGNTRNELYLWHYFGDPSMQMWGGDPIKLPIVNQFTAIFRKEIPGPNPLGYGVQVSLPGEFNGQAFSLLRNGQVIGKGIAGGGTANVPAAFGDGQPKPGELKVAFEGDGAVPITIPVDGVPAQKTATTLSVDCPDPVGWNQDATINGRLSPAFAGAEVELTYTRPSGGTVVRSATTNARGDFTDVFDTGPANDPNSGTSGGTWEVSARYAGDSTRSGSGPVSCSFEEIGG